MKKLLSDYWDQFIDVDNEGKSKGNGIKFEKLVSYLLSIMYGKQWKKTSGSHDNNRDFWIHLSEQSIWAECKNYQKTIAMDILAPTLVMAQIYEVNEILFFSRSKINNFAKNKITTFGEKTQKSIRFFDGENLENLICTYESKLPKKYSPSKYIITSKNKHTLCSVDVYYLQNITRNIHDDNELFINYETIESIHYNETFALSFCITNNFNDEKVDISIEFIDEDTDRFLFQYFYPTIHENKIWYSACLKKGEGRCVTLNMRQAVYQHQLRLPRFRISFLGLESNEHYEWISKIITVKSNWIGSTRLIGKNYLKILDDTEEQLVGNPYLSGLMITGSSGTGKTRILSEIQNIFLKNGYRIFSISGQENFTSQHFIRELIAFLYEIPGDELLELAEEKISNKKLRYKISQNSNAHLAINLLKIIIRCTSEGDLQKKLNQYSNILYEKLSKDKNVIIIDNLQFTGKTFQNFIEQYVYYGVNQQTRNQSVLITVFNTDYITIKTSELLYNITHANIKQYLPITLKGFIEPEHGVQFLQELTRSNQDENIKYFTEIVKKVSLKPYNLYQTTKYLEESGIIEISPQRTGYILSNLQKYKVIDDISDGITDVLKKRFYYLTKNITQEKLMLIFSVIYIFDFFDDRIQQIFKIKKADLDFLCTKNVLRISSSNTYIFDHDIIRNFFSNNFYEHLLKCLEYIYKEKKLKEIQEYEFPVLLYKIVIEKDNNTIIELGERISKVTFPERIASLFYNRLLEAFKQLLKDGCFKGVFITYIHNICTFIRQYDGSDKAWKCTKEMYDIIQKHYPNALSEHIKFYRPFIHFCCDIAVQTHKYDEQIIFMTNVLNCCESAQTTGNDNQDELNVLQAIMYNRWYVSFNTESYKNEIAIKRQFLMKKSREFVKKIVDPQKRGLIEYLNNSDEGYNYYGYEKDKEKLFSIWDKCIIDIPNLVPEKTLNYYRKTVQYGLIQFEQKTVETEIQKALIYLEEGEFSHEPIIFKTFFLMAEVMANLQHNPEKSYYYNVDIIKDILVMQQLLNNHKIGDILLLKGVNAFYGGNAEEVYYSFKEAYKHYDAGETSRYWIKKDLLIENIQYSFTQLGIYMTGYDMSFLPHEYRQPLVLFNNKFSASGILRTSDGYLNLPLI